MIYRRFGSKSKLILLLKVKALLQSSKRAIIWLLIASGLPSFLTTLAVSEESDDYSTAPKITNTSDISIYLQTLEEVLNAENIAPQPIEPRDLSLDSSYVRVGVLNQTLQDSKQFASASGARRVHIRLDLVSVNQLSDGYLVRCNLIASRNNARSRRPIVLELSRMGGRIVAKTLGGLVLDATAAAAYCTRIDSDTRAQTTSQSASLPVDTSNHFSPELLIPKYFSPGSHPPNGPEARLSAASSIRQFGYDILSQPYGILAARSQEMLAGVTVDWGFLIVSDFNRSQFAVWGKKMYNGTSDSACFGFGRYGAGLEEFNSPTGIGFCPQAWFVISDGYNNRASLCHAEIDGLIACDTTFTDDYDYAADAACAKISPTFYQSTGFVAAVVDRGHNRIQVYAQSAGKTFTLRRTFPTYGSGVYLSRPSSVCFGINRNTKKQLSWMYVADAGNRRIVAFDVLGNPDYPLTGFFMTNYNFPTDAFLSSITVDPYGYIWVLDSYNSKIYVFSSGLDQLIAIYGGKGVEDGKFYHPNRFKFVEGWNLDGTNMRLGDSYVTELFGPETGIRKYVYGNDILWHYPSFIPRHYVGDYPDLECTWWQTGPTDNWVKTYFQGVMVDSQYFPMRLPGKQVYSWQMPDTVHTGLYKMEVHSRSIYLSSFETEFRDSIQGDSVLSTVFQGCTHEFDSVSLPSGYANDNYYSPQCLHVSPSRWYKATAWVHGTCQFGRQYQWQACPPFNFPIYEDTLGAPPNTVLHTSNNYAYFKITNRPANHVETDHLFVIDMQEWCGDTIHPVPPDSQGGANLVEPNTIALPCGEFKFLEIVHSSPCSTSCVYCPPNPPGGCPFLYVWSDSAFKFVNNILPQSEIAGDRNTLFKDTYPIPAAAPGDPMCVRLRVSEEEREVSQFDAFSLIALDVDETYRSVMFDKNMTPIVLEEPSVVPSSAVCGGNDVTRLLATQDSIFFESDHADSLDVVYHVRTRMTATADSGDTVIDWGGVTTNSISKPPDPMKPVVGAPGASEGNYLTMRAKALDGRWVEIRRVGPRLVTYSDVTPLSSYVFDGKIQLRLVWSREIKIDYLPFSSYRRVPFKESACLLDSAVQSRAGEVKSQLISEDNDFVQLTPNESIDLTFRTSDFLHKGSRRLFLFTAKGRYERPLDQSGIDALPDKFDFSQNYPNPFNPSTTFSYALPTASHVTLTVYNILGQRVAALVDEHKPAGNYRVEWTSKTEEGRTLPSGVYFAKFMAGTYSASRKVMIIK